jgi:hypothetical protein
MNQGGWLMFGLSWGIIIGLMFFCFIKVLFKKE